MTVYDLPAVNAALNTTSCILLIIGYYFIIQKKEKLHKRFMLSACVSSTFFLISYLTYHYHTGSNPFQGDGWIRPVYFTILISHTLLAILVLPMVIVTAFRGLKDYRTKHKMIARWTFPVWMYVSVTGVIIYFMLYHL